MKNICDSSPTTLRITARLCVAHPVSCVVYVNHLAPCLSTARRCPQTTSTGGAWYIMPGSQTRRAIPVARCVLTRRAIPMAGSHQRGGAVTEWICFKVTAVRLLGASFACMYNQAEL